ncbi:MAG: hypothetical protein AAF654_13155 [Myxococcota bacterium]
MIQKTAACLLFATLAAGCYTTRLGNDVSAASGPMQVDRQWFALAGAVAYGEPAEPDCLPGQSVVYVESGLGGYDILLDLGFGLAGAALGAGIASLAKDDISDEDLATAANFGALSPALIASRRTIRWTCASNDAAVSALPKAPDAFNLPGTLSGH